MCFFMYRPRIRIQMCEENQETSIEMTSGIADCDNRAEKMTRLVELTTLYELRWSRIHDLHAKNSSFIERGDWEDETFAW
jgi:hypothetical protein